LLDIHSGLSSDDTPDLYLHVGLTNGVMLKTAVDSTTGTLTDTRTRFLGTKPIRLFKIMIQGRDALLALTSRPWISYTYIGKQYTTPLTCDCLDYASNFTSP